MDSHIMSDSWMALFCIRYGWRKLKCQSCESVILVHVDRESFKCPMCKVIQGCE